jgi:hypothetical protein
MEVVRKTTTTSGPQQPRKKSKAKMSTVTKTEILPGQGGGKIPKNLFIERAAVQAKLAKARQKYDIKTNQYLMSILDPFGHRGARIPDLCSFPSVPIAIDWKCTLTPGSFPGGGANQALISPALQNMVVSSSTANWTFNGGANPPNYSSITAAYMGLRPVSMGVKLKWVGAPLNATGEIGVMPFLPNFDTLPVSWADFQTRRGFQVFGCLETIYMIWKPLDVTSYRYQQSTFNVVTTAGLIANAFVSALPTMIVALNGVDVNGYMEMNIYANFEGIPATGVWTPGGTNASKSPVDTRALEIAHRVIAQVDQAIATQNQNTPSDDNGFLGFVKKAATFGAQVYSSVEPLVKLIGEIL